jgi:surface antigen
MHELVSRPPPYNATAFAGIRLRARAGIAAVLVLSLALSTGGCAFSYQLGSLFGKDDDKPEVSATGVVAPTAAVKSIPDLPEGDLAYARAAAGEVLSSGEKRGAHWENPRTGARGMVTPIAEAYTQDGLTCRGFLASYVRDGAEEWLQGEACRLREGQWEVRSLKPWKRA